MGFAGLEFFVGERVLVLRARLAEPIFAGFSPWANKVEVKLILEIGTGSGCIPIALKKQLPNAEIFAIDISDEALKVARKNAETNEVAIQFKKDDVVYLEDLNIIEEEEKYSIYIKKGKDVLPWKDFNKNMAISVEYNLEYQ